MTTPLSSADPKSPTSAQELYRQLREMILNFDLYPGSRVTETELAEQFHVSRTPIRSALQRLEAEGYVTIQAKRGCFIRNLDIESIMNYYRVRVALEELSLELACQWMSEDSLIELATLWSPSALPDHPRSLDEMELRDESFHIRLAEGGDNQALMQYLQDINHRIRVIRRLDFTAEDRINKTYAEHHDICQHLLRRDLAAAKAAMRAHITYSEEFAKGITLVQLARHRQGPR